MPLAPVTEDDKSIIEGIIQKLVSLRKRECANSESKYFSSLLDDPIRDLHEYGAMKDWWKSGD